MWVPNLLHSFFSTHTVFFQNIMLLRSQKNLINVMNRVLDYYIVEAARAATPFLERGSEAAYIIYNELYSAYLLTTKLIF
jgi:hypothetical protein